MKYVIWFWAHGVTTQLDQGLLWEDALATLSHMPFNLRDHVCYNSAILCMPWSFVPKTTADNQNISGGCRWDHRGKHTKMAQKLLLFSWNPGVGSCVFFVFWLGSRMGCVRFGCPSSLRVNEVQAVWQGLGRLMNAIKNRATNGIQWLYAQIMDINLMSRYILYTVCLAMV